MAFSTVKRISRLGLCLALVLIFGLPKNLHSAESAASGFLTRSEIASKKIQTLIEANMGSFFPSEIKSSHSFVEGCPKAFFAKSGNTFFFTCENTQYIFITLNPETATIVNENNDEIKVNFGNSLFEFSTKSRQIRNVRIVTVRPDGVTVTVDLIGLQKYLVIKVPIQGKWLGANLVEGKLESLTGIFWEKMFEPSRCKYFTCYPWDIKEWQKKADFSLGYFLELTDSKWIRQGWMRGDHVAFREEYDVEFSVKDYPVSGVLTLDGMTTMKRFSLKNNRTSFTLKDQKLVLDWNKNSVCERNTWHLNEEQECRGFRMDKWGIISTNYKDLWYRLTSKQEDLDSYDFVFMGTSGHGDFVAKPHK